MARPNVPAPNDIVTQKALDAKITQILKIAINIAHPVGSYYMSESDVDPKEYLGGVWEKVEGRFILASDRKHKAGEMGGSSFHKISLEELPEHSHRPGSLNVTGTFCALTRGGIGDGNLQSNVKGAFSYDESNTSGTEEISRGGRTGVRKYEFNAQGNWSGVTSSVGEGVPYDTMPPYLVAHIWKRIK